MPNSKDERETIYCGAETLNEMLGPAVDVSSAAGEKDAEKLNALAFELYKEAICVLNLASHLLDDTAAANNGFPRNQAICAGLMIRVTKFMIVVAQLSTKGNRGEVVFALNRSIMESAINLEFLVRAQEDKYFDQFVEVSLAPERELYDLIQANIAARNGEVWQIEQRMLESITDVCRVSGVKIEDVNQKHREWGNSMRDRLKALNKEFAYVSTQRIPSHAVHGSWVDLYKQHLDFDERGNVFRPETKWTPVDARLLGPVALLVLDAVEPYVKRFFPAIPECKLLMERIDSLRNRIIEVDSAHEEIVASQGGA